MLCPYCHHDPHLPRCIEYAPPVEPLAPLPPPPAQTHSAPSVEAAEAIGPQAESLREAVLLYLKRCENGATDEEMQEALGMNPSTQRPRRIELVRAGRVQAVGIGTTRSGRSATVWFASENVRSKPIEKID